MRASLRKRYWIIPVEVVLLGVVHGLEALLGRLDIHSFASHVVGYRAVRIGPKNERMNERPDKADQ
jgi:hypothetical protein